MRSSLRRGSQPAQFWDDIRRHKVAVFNFIGAMTLILSKKEPADDDLDNDVKVAYGVPALPGELRDELERRYGMKVDLRFRHERDDVRATRAV